MVFWWSSSSRSITGMINPDRRAASSLGLEPEVALAECLGRDIQSDLKVFFSEKMDAPKVS